MAEPTVGSAIFVLILKCDCRKKIVLNLISIKTQRFKLQRINDIN